MSLQVWLPLNGNVNNQGLGGHILNGSPASWSQNGKIGSCATFNGNVGNIIYNNTTDFNYTDNFSFCLWINPNYTGSATQYAFTVGRADYGGYGYGLSVPNASTIAVRFGNVVVYVSCPSNEWHHIAFTVSGTVIKVYKDGILYKTTATGTLPTYSDGNGLGIGCFHCSFNIYPFYGSLNDFRIYDHCLSAKEVKEISKGLMCHYRLSGCGGENYMKNNSYNPAITICGYGNSTYAKSQVDINDGFVSGTFTKITRGSSGSGDTRLGWTVNDINIPHELYNDKKITVSCWVKSTTGTVIDMRIGRYSDKDMRVIISPATIPKDTWKLIKGSTVFSSESDYASTDRLELYMTCNLNTDYIMSQIKVEISDTATPWCPNPADELYSTLGYNDTTEYDCSGYGNNGAKVGNIVWKGDSARYSGSYGISGVNRINASNIAFENMEHGTLSFWIKFNNSFNNWSHYVIFANAFNWTGNGKDFVIIANATQLSSTANASSTNINVDCCSYGKGVTVTADTWYHIVITWDAKNYVIKKYFNGDLIQTVDDSTNKRLDTYRSSHNYHFIGNGLANTGHSGDFNISDLRIFSTVLDGSDIKSLYNVAASADKSGVFSAYEFVEG